MRQRKTRIRNNEKKLENEKIKKAEKEIINLQEIIELLISKGADINIKDVICQIIIQYILIKIILN